MAQRETARGQANGDRKQYAETPESNMQHYRYVAGAGYAVTAASATRRQDYRSPGVEMLLRSQGPLLLIAFGRRR